MKIEKARQNKEKEENSLRERLKDNFKIALKKEIKRQRFLCPECEHIFKTIFDGKYPEICPECGWVQLGTRSVFE